MVLGAASHICWQCHTYFRHYGTGMMQQIMGVTLQQHNILVVRVPERGPHQHRLPEEERAQEWRDDSLSLLRPPILQILLPRAYLLILAKCINLPQLSRQPPAFI